MDAVATISDPKLFTRKEAAVKLRISLVSLDKLISSKKICTVTVGKRILISQNALQDFINKGGDK